MSEKKYDLIITSVDPATELTLLSQKLGKALRKNPQQIEFSLNEIASIGGSDFSIIRGTTQTKAKQLQAYLVKQGLGSDIRDEVSLEAMAEEAPEYTCPACDHRQELDPKGNDICESCGTIGRKYADIKRRKDILESERRRHQTLQQMGLEQSKDRQTAEEEKRLREDARKKLGIKKDKFPLLLAGVVILMGVGFVMAYLYMNELFPSAQNITTEQMAVNNVAKQQPMLSVPLTGGNITLNMPTGGSGSASGGFQTAQAAVQSTVVTTENSPPMTDSSSQNLALQINQQSTDKELATEARVKASLVAHSIDSSSSRKAVLQITGGEEAIVDQAMIDHVTMMEQENIFIKDPQLDQLLMIAGDQILQGNYTQAVEIARKVEDKYQQAVLLHKIIKAEIKDTSTQTRADEHIAQLAKLIWNEVEPTKQVRIQGLLSMAYYLADEKKVASLNLVMAIEKLRFVESDEMKIELLCQLSKGQRSIGNISQAREILKLAEDKANNLDLASQSEAYAEIVTDYAKVMDFSSALKLTEKIYNPVLLRDTLGIITEIQDSYMSVSNSPV